MSYNNNPYNTYKQVSVKTASQGKLVVMLYENAVLSLERAINLIDDNNKIAANNIESFGNYIQKAMDIISELQVSLDMEKGGEIASNLMALYIFFNKELLASTINHDKKTLTSIKNMLSELYNSWLTAANSTANSQVQPQSVKPSLNITG